MIAAANATRVLVVGSLNMDLIAQVARLPRPGETVSATGWQTVPGGKGANQAVAAARLGASVQMIGQVGNDVFGPSLVQALADAKVDTAAVGHVVSAPTGMAMIQVDGNGNNAIVVVPGANELLRPRHLEAAATLFEQADVMLCQLEVPLDTVVHAIRMARAHEVFTVLDPAPASEEAATTGDLFAVDVLTPNQTEAEMLTELSMDCVGAVALAQACLARGPRLVVLTLAEAGCVAVSHWHEPVIMPAFPSTAVDPTAAGDAFTAGLTLQLAAGAELRDALRYATACGALAVRQLGAMPSLPGRAEVDDFLANS